MVSSFGTCPRCQSELSESRKSGTPVVCQACGFTPNLVEKQFVNKLENSFIKRAILLSAILLGSLMQAASWDQYALEIIPLKVKQFTGMANREDLNQIAKICLAKFKFDCVETAYAQMADQGDNESLAELGKFQVRRGKIREANSTLASYFSHGGLDLEASYQFARVLSQVGQVDKAAQYFDQVLAAKPDTLQVTVTQNYVKMLINNGRGDQAKKLIESVRKTSTSASLFMDEEFKSLNHASRD